MCHKKHINTIAFDRTTTIFRNINLSVNHNFGTKWYYTCIYRDCPVRCRNRSTGCTILSGIYATADSAGTVCSDYTFAQLFTMFRSVYRLTDFSSSRGRRTGSGIAAVTGVDINQTTASGRRIIFCLCNLSRYLTQFLLFHLLRHLLCLNCCFFSCFLICFCFFVS